MIVANSLQIDSKSQLTANQGLPKYPRLESVTMPTLTTVAAAYYLNRKPQTLRIWACYGGPIRPLRVNGRLAWPVSEIRKILGMEVPAND